MCSYQLSIIILHLLHVCIDRFKYLGAGLGKMHDTRDRIVWFWEVQLVAQNIPHITLITTAHYSWPVSLAPGPVHRSSSQDTSPNVYISTAILPWVCRVVAFSPRLSGRAHCPFALTTTKYSVLSGRPALRSWTSIYSEEVLLKFVFVVHDLLIIIILISASSSVADMSH